MRADVHMHTNFSHDSESTPEEMVKGAIEKGLEVICFTDHYDKDKFEWGPEDIFAPEEYFAHMIPLKEKYKGIIDVRIGVELGLQPYLKDYYREFVAKYPFDFVIGSVHSAKKRDLAAGSLFEKYTDEEVYRITLEETLEDVKDFQAFDVLGHMDYVTRYGKQREKEYSYHKYADLIDEILRTLIENGKGIELNMAGLKYGLPYAHPHMDVLKRYRELGGEIITIGSDGHKPEHIAYDYHKVSEILTACNFAFYTEFSSRKPKFMHIV